MVKIFSSMMAAMGKQLKQSVKVFHSLMLYRRLPGWGLFRVVYNSRNKHTFVVKAIDAIYTRTFVIAAEDEKVFRVFDLVGEE